MHWRPIGAVRLDTSVAARIEVCWAEHTAHERDLRLQTGRALIATCFAGDGARLCEYQERRKRPPHATLAAAARRLGLPYSHLWTLAQVAWVADLLPREVVERLTWDHLRALAEVTAPEARCDLAVACAERGGSPRQLAARVAQWRRAHVRRGRPLRGGDRPRGSVTSGVEASSSP